MTSLADAVMFLPIVVVAAMIWLFWGEDDER